MRKRRDVEAFSLSFLDCICCGFGAIILLLVLTKVFEPIIYEDTVRELEGQLADLQQQFFEIRGETDILNRNLTSKQEQLSLEHERLARLQADLSSLRSRFEASEDDSELASIIQKRLAEARQSLTEEMQRLLANVKELDENTVGGIPVDSEYIIFVIDTSGSMFGYAWDLAVRKVQETLAIYPKVKGIQVMNDMGKYMFTRYQGKWIPDTPARRKAIVERLRTWNAFSNSSPVEGINRAISTFYTPGIKISIYVFGDEFTGTSIEHVVDTIDRINKEDAQGNRLVRIHGVGFPVQFLRPGHMQATGIRFATLMRILSEKNGGTFVGLNSVRP